MRVVQNSQMLLGQIAIAEITFDPRSRDDIPKILRGLQHVYLNAPLRNAIFALLETEIAPKVSKTQGRPGMPLWTILVCGVLRLDLNTDYDRLHELVNHHDTLRQMLGHSPDYPYTYAYQTLVDNVNLLTPELLDKINTLVVKEGHLLLKRATQPCVGAATPLSLKPMCITPPTSRCCTMPCAKRSPSPRSGATKPTAANGDNTVTKSIK